MLKVDIENEGIDAIIRITDSPDYLHLHNYFAKLREHGKEKLVKENNDLVRGECQLLERLMGLRETMVRERK